MSWLSNAFDKVKNVVSSVGSAVGKVASVALPVAGFAVGLVAPGLGAAIGKVADKIGNKVSEITGIGDGKPGILGIGDGMPGVLGIGTGKNKQENLEKTAEAVLDIINSKVDSGKVLTDADKAAKSSAEKQLNEAKVVATNDIKKEGGVNPLYLLFGGLAALFVLKD